MDLNNLSIKSNIVPLIGVLIFLFVIGYNKQVFILTLIIILYLFYQKYFSSPRDLIDYIETFINTYFQPLEDNKIIQQLNQDITHIPIIEKTRKELFNYINNINDEIQNGNIIMSSITDNSNIDMIITDYIDTFQNLFQQYYQITDLLTNTNQQYPQQTMVTYLDTQRQILQELHNFIFISPSSKLPPTINTISNTLSNTFNKINKFITNKHNNKLPEEYNMYSSILPETHEPLAKNTYLDNKSLY